MIPQSMLNKRQLLSEQYLAGQGIEIGALHYPLSLSEKAKVQYVDRLDTDGLRKQYPELNNLDLVDVDIIDEGEKLTKIDDNQLDFIIGNHFLEHCQNPLGTIRNHLSKIKDEGVLYYSVPDKRHSFDIDRSITSFSHLVKDDILGTDYSRKHHFQEWVTLVNKVEDPEEAEKQLDKLLEINYSIHFHVWDIFAFEEFIFRAQSYLDESFKVEKFEQNEMEIITILRKRKTKYRLPEEDSLVKEEQISVPLKNGNSIANKVKRLSSIFR